MGGVRINSSPRCHVESFTVYVLYIKLSRPISVGVNSPLREMKQVELNRNEVVNR